MSDVKLGDLRIHYRPEGGLPKQIKQRPASVADLVAALLNEGGEIRRWCEAHDSDWLEAGPIHRGCGWANELKPCVESKTQRLVVPLEDE